MMWWYTVGGHRVGILTCPKGEKRVCKSIALTEDTSPLTHKLHLLK